MATGGSVVEVSIGGRIFAVAADADTGRKLGGKETEVEMNGDGTARDIKKTVAWLIDGLTLSIDENRADQDYLQDCSDGVNADSEGNYPITVTYASGHTRGGKGKPTGEIKANSMNTTCAVTLSGPGKLELQ